jgi:hypothetical protein
MVATIFKLTHVQWRTEHESGVVNTWVIFFNESFAHYKHATLVVCKLNRVEREYLTTEYQEMPTLRGLGEKTLVDTS